MSVWGISPWSLSPWSVFGAVLPRPILNLRGVITDDSYLTGIIRDI